VKYPVLILAAFALIAATPDPTPPPSPPPPTVVQPSAAPAASVSPAPDASSSSGPLPTPTPDLDTIFGTKHGKRGAGAEKPTPSPPPQRKGLDGVWEIQIQRGPNVQYEHMKLAQTGQALNGTYIEGLGKVQKVYPVTGSLDSANNVHLVVSLPDGSTILLEARVDGTTDMLGMFTDAKERVPFTAAYRAKENWIENVNAAPAGLSSSGGP
jgi:hypothetical protein